METKSTTEQTDLKNVPVRALRPRSREKLACMLNGRKLILSPNGYCRDHRGIAELMGMSISGCWSAYDNPMDVLLDKSEDSLYDLLEFLKLIDRFDVVEDSRELLMEDAEQYKLNITRMVPTCNRYQSEKDVLVIGDTLEYKRRFHAFLLYVDDDSDFARDVINTLESDPFNIKLCVRDRDVVGGALFEHMLIQKLIAERCDRLITILSDEFFQSDKHLFFVQFAGLLTFETRARKIIPLKYKECHNMPIEYSQYFALDLRRGNLISNFWKRLHESIVTPMVDNCESSITISEITKSLPPVSKTNTIRNGSIISEIQSPIVETPESSSAVSSNKAIDTNTASSSKEFSKSVRKKLSSFFKVYKIKKSKKVPVCVAYS